MYIYILVLCSVLCACAKSHGTYTHMVSSSISYFSGSQRYKSQHLARAPAAGGFVPAPRVPDFDAGGTEEQNV